MKTILALFICLLLSACNGGGSSSSTPAQNLQPVAHAGNDIEVNALELVTLNGRDSYDPDDEFIYYKWEQISGPQIALSSNIDDTPSFIAPNEETVVRYQLVTSDGKTSSVPDIVAITVHLPENQNDSTSDQSGDGSSNSSGGANSGNGSSSNSDNSNSSDNSSNNSGSDTNNNTDTNNGSDTSTDSDNHNSDDDSSNTDSTDNTDTNTNPNTNLPPIANAGSDISVSGSTMVTLDGSASSDPENLALQYHWTQVSGSSVTLNDPTVEFPSFISPNQNEVLIFSLVVDDGEKTSEPDQVNIQISEEVFNQAPVAVPGENQIVNGNDLVMLSAINSFDPENDSLSFIWTQTSGALVELENANTENASFIAPEQGGDFEFSLTVNDGLQDSESASILVSVDAVDSSLIANAGADQRVKSGNLVTLDASQSSVSSATISYEWRQTGGEPVTLNSLTSPQPQFTAPQTSENIPLALSFALVVSDGIRNSPADTVLITVDNTNLAPVADAGAPIYGSGDSNIVLDGTASYDPDQDPLTFEWLQTSGAQVTLDDAESSSPSFTAPHDGGDFQFSLRVSDGSLISELSYVDIQVTPANNPPIANAGVDRYVGSLSIVALKGINSSDPDGDSITYVWEQISGPTITLSDLYTSNPTFEAHTDGQLVFSLTVNDGQLNSQADTVVVTVGPIPATNIKVNGTGITWGANFPSGNNLDCSGEAIEQQDCSGGRELTHNDDSDGRAGFSFTKFDQDGVETDHSDPDWSCVQDSVTGLMWEIKSGGNDISGDEGLNDADDRYSWFNSDASSNGGAEGFADSKGDVCFGYDEENPQTWCNTQAYVERMNTAGWCGYADWRLPTRKELLSIIDYGESAPMIDTSYFPSSSGNTWTSSPFAIGTTSAWGVNFNYGNSFSLDKRNANQVRLVRGGYEE